MNVRFRACVIVYLGLRLLAGPVAAQVIQPIYYFTNSSSASPRNPLAGLTVGPDGALYGTTKFGGTGSGGTVFKITTNGDLSVLANLAAITDGAFPKDRLSWGPDGNFYGTAPLGGSNGSGTFFRMTTNGLVTVLFSFGRQVSNGNALTNRDGGAPYSGVTLGQDGCWYGTTSSGGTNGGGTLYKVTTDGSLTTLLSFGAPNTYDGRGWMPLASLTLGPDGNFYGTTADGGDNSNAGTVFKVTPEGALTQLAVFSFTNGAAPQGALAFGADGSLYGTTPGNVGTVFKTTTNGGLTTLFYFNTTTASYPCGGLTLGPDGCFYGTLARGSYSTNAAGAIFRMTPAGTVSILAYFNGTNGYDPEAGLTLGPDGNFYGTTYNGGIDSNAAGVIYRFSLGWTNPASTITLRPDGVALLHFATTSGTTNRLWATTNLSLPMTQWDVLTTNVATNNFFDFQDANTSGNPVKYYRLSAP